MRRVERQIKALCKKALRRPPRDKSMKGRPAVKTKAV